MCDRLNASAGLRDQRNELSEPDWRAVSISLVSWSNLRAQK